MLVLGDMGHRIPLSAAGDLPSWTQEGIFQSVYWFFLILGTIVGVVVIGYACYNLWKYRDDGGEDEYADDKKVTRPRPGELPSSSGGGRKLFLSFGISAIIVLGLIAWTYGLLIDVEGATTDYSADMEVDVYGSQWSWTFQYPNGENETETLRLPEGQLVELRVTSTDVFHSFGIPEQRVKADAIPGQVIARPFITNETGTYVAHCYELCGANHARMDAEVVVMPQDEFQAWYQNTSG